MPFFKVDNRLVYYAHVPKCGGSSVAAYIRERFGDLAFHDNAYLDQPHRQRWTATSPQHVDAATLERLIPLSLFAAAFATVRHPVERVVSVYHFQLEREHSIPAGTRFADWLKGLEERHASERFAYDNHSRTMSEIVPEGAAVFHIEHGLDALVPWFDALARRADGPRVIVPENVRGQVAPKQGARVRPTDADMELIARLYAADFKRFGYVLGETVPRVQAPEISPDFLATRDRAREAAAGLLGRMRRRVMRKIRRL